MIEVDRATKIFGQVTAVGELTFSVQPGQVTAFLGPNGAGKSTTMRMILGLDLPTSGSTSINGRSYQTLTQPLHDVGSLLDANALHPGRSGHAHLLSIAQSNGISSARVAEVLDLTGMTEPASRRAKEYSLGMKQRLGIAAALLGDPHTFILDEPVNGLDPEGIRWSRDLLKGLAAEGRTVFVSSHLMSELSLVADHLIIIGRGKLLADTSMQDFVNAHSHTEVLVRASDAPKLASLVSDKAENVRGGGDNEELLITGLDAKEIADAAAAHQIAIYELTPQHASLEDAYLEITRDSVQYQGKPTSTRARG